MVVGHANHHLLANDYLAIYQSQLILSTADTNDGCLGLVDDGSEAVGTKHTDVGDGDAAVAHIVGHQLAGLGLLGQLLGFLGDLAQTLLVYILDHGNQQTIIQTNCHTNIDLIVQNEVAALDGHAETLLFGDHLAYGLDDHIVYGDLVGLFLAGIDLLAQSQQLGHVDLDILSNIGDLVVAGKHTLSDNLAHTRHLVTLDHLFDLSNSSLNGSLSRSGSSGSSRLQVSAGDLAAVTGTGHTLQIDAHIGSHGLSQRGSLRSSVHVLFYVTASYLAPTTGRSYFVQIHTVVISHLTSVRGSGYHAILGLGSNYRSSCGSGGRSSLYGSGSGSLCGSCRSSLRDLLTGLADICNGFQYRYNGTFLI